MTPLGEAAVAFLAVIALGCAALLTALALSSGEDDDDRGDYAPTL